MMEKHFLEFYNQELAHLRGIAQEFAAEFPKIASRLRISEFDCEDPYVERLLEGFAFLTSRIHQKLNDSFPRFTESILSAVFPIVWAPVPSMAVLQMQPDLSQSTLTKGIRVPRNTSFKCKSFTEDQTPCEFRNSSDVTLWPIEIVDVKYIAKEAGEYKLDMVDGVSSAIYIRLRNVLKMPFSHLALDQLPLFLNAPDEMATSLLEHIFADKCGLLVRDVAEELEQTLLGPETIQFRGCQPENSVLPNVGRRFRGYRLFLEYFSFPSRFKFFELSGLQQGLQACKGNEIELFVLLKKRHVNYAKSLDAQKLKLFCTPAINLFPKRTDRIVYDKSYEYHVIPERTHPRDYEVYSVERVTGFDAENTELFDINRFYHTTDKMARKFGNFFFAHRRPRIVPRKRSQRSSYVGSEVFLNFAGPDFQEYSESLTQISIETLCTNRDLPLLIDPKAQLAYSGTAAIQRTDFIVPPSHPHPSPAQCDRAWNAISHLRLSYSDLFECEDQDREEIVKNIIRLYCPQQCDFGRQQIEGIKTVNVKPVTRRLYGEGHLYFAQGLEVSITFDEYAFAGMGCFLLGLLLREFLCHYVTINSFVEVVIHTVQRGELIRWEPITGTRNVI